MRRPLAILAVSLLLGAGQPPIERKDPLNAIEPRSAPGAGQKFLERFVGSWRVAKTFHPRAGDPATVKGECKQTMIHDGRFLQSDFTFPGDKGKTTGMGLIGFDAETGAFTSVWTDSRSTRMSFRSGKEKFDGEKIVLYAQALGDGKARPSRTETCGE